MTARDRLPNRRPSELIDFEFRGLAYVLGLSRYPDGRVSDLRHDTRYTGRCLGSAFLPQTTSADHGRLCFRRPVGCRFTHGRAGDFRQCRRSSAGYDASALKRTALCTGILGAFRKLAKDSEPQRTNTLFHALKSRLRVRLTPQMIHLSTEVRRCKTASMIT